MKYLRAGLGVILGYLVMVVLITLVQEVLFGGVSWHKSTLTELVIAGGLTFASAVFAGILATRVVAGKSIIPALIMTGFVAVETSLLIFTGKIGGPLWFDLAGSGSLMVGILVGWYLLGMLTKNTGGLTE